MNITPHVNNLPVATVVNPPTDSLRRENVQRPIITAPTATSGSPAEKGAADKEKASGQVGEQLNFSELQKSAEKNATQISENAEQGNKESSEQNTDDQDSTQESDQNTAEAEPNSLEAFQHDKEIQQLKQRDQEVRSHELAHASVGGASTGSPSYEFKVGPDGKKYAVNGEVSVDLSTVDGNPRATIAKMQKVHAAALAPANPSVQDTKVAAKASELITQAQSELIALELALSESENQTSTSSPYVDSSDVFNQEKNAQTQSQTFDEQINGTLKSQENIAPTIPSDIKERAQRVEGYYSGITQAYEKAPSYQFELTA